MHDNFDLARDSLLTH